MARRPKSRMIGFKGEPALMHALAELATREAGRSVSALLRDLAWEHVQANAGQLTEPTRKAIDQAKRVRGRWQWVRPEDRHRGPVL